MDKADWVLQSATVKLNDLRKPQLSIVGQFFPKVLGWSPPTESRKWPLHLDSVAEQAISAHQACPAKLPPGYAANGAKDSALPHTCWPVSPWCWAGKFAKANAKNQRFHIQTRRLAGVNRKMAQKPCKCSLFYSKS